MPAGTDDAHKYVREAVQAFPELYFSRLVVLGEGDTEEIILPRLMNARGLPADESAISVVPLGGRHVNHFWRLLTALEIPFITLLDLDAGRNQGGWGRIHYVATQLQKFAESTCGISEKHVASLPVWNSARTTASSENMLKWINFLETKDVFFSAPLDLDFALLTQFPVAYGVSEDDIVEPDEAKIQAVLGGSYHDVEQYSEEQQMLFITYQKKFKLGSKPAAHLSASASIDDVEFAAEAPPFLTRLLDAVAAKLQNAPE
jgi:putative ATP-dependent endonuclease of OLD family